MLVAAFFSLLLWLSQRFGHSVCQLARSHPTLALLSAPVRLSVATPRTLLLLVSMSAPATVSPSKAAAAAAANAVVFPGDSDDEVPAGQPTQVAPGGALAVEMTHCMSTVLACGQCLQLKSAFVVIALNCSCSWKTFALAPCAY